MGKIFVQVEKVRDATEKALRKQGYDDQEVKQIAQMLMFAQLRGSNQGVVKLIGGGMPKVKPTKSIEIVKETGLSALIDGNQNHGIVVMNKAIQVALDKVQKSGVAIVGTFNTSTTSGALSYYGDYFASRGLIAFVFSGSPPSVAPYGTTEALFGTNPICIGVPGKDGNVVLDLATSSMAYYGLIEAQTENRTIPMHIGFDVDGNPTNEPGKVLDGGAIRPFDQSHKSGGLNLMVEILTGPLVHASFASFGDVDNWGNFIFLIDPKLFTYDLAADVQQLVNKVKTLRKEDKSKKVYVPGEKGNQTMQEAIKRGTLEIESNLYTELLKAAGLNSKL